MPSDQQLQATLDRILTGLRSQLEGVLRAHADEVRRHANDQLGHLRDAATQNEDARRSAETQITELRRLLDDLRRTPQEQLEAVRKTLETEVAAARARADADADIDIADARRVTQVEDVQGVMVERIAELTRDLTQTREALDAARQEMTDVHTRAAAQAAAEAEELIIAQLANAQAEQDQRVTDAVDRTRDERVTHSRRLGDEIRTLDESRSLGKGLELLMQFAGREVDRAAVLIVRNGLVEEWRRVGSRALGPNPEPLAEAADSRGLIGSAVREGHTVSRMRPTGPGSPAFSVADVPRAAAAFPLTIAGSVVAVLYADAPHADSARDPEWRHTLEVLTRHASRVLEVITLQQAIGVRSPVARASQGPSASAQATADKPGHQAPRGLQ